MNGFYSIERKETIGVGQAIGESDRHNEILLLILCTLERCLWNVNEKGVITRKVPIQEIQEYGYSMKVGLNQCEGMSIALE